MNTPDQTYSLLLQENTAKLAAARKKISLLAYSRFVLFLGICACIFPVVKYSSYWYFAPAAVLLLTFFVLVKQQVETEKKARFLKKLCQVIEAELKAMKNDFSGFDNGSRFIDFDHPYSFDLDVFGEQSLYQQLNRTSSETGSITMAEWLTRPLLSAEDIEQRQQAFRELSEKTVFRLNFQATGSLNPLSQNDQKAISGWMLSEEKKIGFNAFTSVLLLLLPIVTVGLWVTWIAGYVHYSIPSLISSINISWVYSKTSVIGEIHQQLGNRFRLVKNLGAQVSLFENEKFDSKLLNALKERLKGHDTNAGRAIHRLGIIMQNFDTRLNFFGAFIFNALFLFDLQVCKRLLEWKKQFGKAAAGWMDVVSETEACNSMGTYVYNHPDFIFPVAENRPTIIDAAGMGHPLMQQYKRIANSFHFSGEGKFVIITGSNMSGKSTFLRTAGLNMVLAQTGAPVCAQTFRFSPAELYTSMRINDSLQQNESYFYAEIKRLNKITGEAAKQKPMLILLDEILRGTNSADKHTGSQALMLKLTELGATGVLATHDLSLGELAQQYPGRFENKCFESVIENNELYFDYKMRDGVCQNLNAVFLMKKMGIM